MVLPAMASPLDATVQEAANAVMQAYNVPGLAIGISVNGKQQFYTYGVASKADATPVTADTLFEVGSISKTLTATLAAYAQANGQLSLNETVGSYLPELRNTPFGNVTLIGLATHTAGGFPLQVPDDVQNDAQLMDYLIAWQPAYPQGTQRSYANPSIGMLGMITAKRMHLPYTQALQDQLLPALGMKNSYLQVPASEMPRYAQGYNKEDAPVRLAGGVLADEAYGLKTTVRDLTHFAELNAGMGQVSKTLRRALNATHTGYFRVGPMTQDLVWEQYPYPVRLGALLEGNASQMVYETQPVVALDPPLAPQREVWINKTGSTNGFGGYIAFVPAKKQAVVILANKNYPNEARVKLAHTLLQALD
ncbi:class C beta-lactamase [Pseudomonas sp. WS 5071]|uniref:class C beta-lactamase n=1 Tax=Pseudomonas sp. WS 5071 TaxID=2717479 RepID=UPI0021CE5BDB|nr:class C beta-lactamase [Pseudomonas sp. WS 5071]